MGIFDFLKGAGRKANAEQIEQDIRDDIHKVLGSQIDNLDVDYDDGTVHLRGLVDYHSTKQKAVLLAGNVDGVKRVDDAKLQVKPLEVHQQEAAEYEAKKGLVEEPADAYTFYTIEKGDTLSGLSKRFYGDASRWNDLFEANRGVISDPDRIYPGQQIRVPTKQPQNPAASTRRAL